MTPLQSFPLDGEGLLWVGEVNGEHFHHVTTPDRKLRMEGLVTGDTIGGRLIDEDTGEVVDVKCRLWDSLKVWTDPRPQCPAELHPPFGVLRCDLRFGHDGPHVHYTDTEGTALAFATDEREWVESSRL